MHNKETPLKVAEEFAVLFGESRDFTRLAPDFFGYLREFPQTPLAGAESLLYWSKEDFGIRPVLSVTHLTLYNRAYPASRLQGLVATKQIYAAHYFDAGLGLTMAFDDGSSGFYMLTVNRARTRSLMGLLRACPACASSGAAATRSEELPRSTKVRSRKAEVHASRFRLQTSHFRLQRSNFRLISLLPRVRVDGLEPWSPQFI